MLKPTASGSKPRIAAVAVNNTGVIRIRPASTIASRTCAPRSRRMSVYSTRRIPLRTTMPASATMPTPAMMTEKSILKSAIPSSTPIMLNITSDMIIRVLPMELNCTIRIIRMMKIEISREFPRNEAASRNSASSPAKPTVTPSVGGQEATADFTAFTTSV